MPYVIGEPCIDTLDRSCVEECPVDCIYEGKRKQYINPEECIDCGACEPVCPVEAIHYMMDMPSASIEHVEDNARFFADPLPTRSAALGNPGGAEDFGAVGEDTELVASLPAREDA